jgi:secreted trypsin-like serine protease
VLETLLVCAMFALLAVLILVCESSGLRSGKIVGGSQAKENSAPFMAEVQSFNGWKFVHKCGAAVIHEHFIVTAGHCVRGLKVKDVRVHVGSNEISKGGKLHEVDKFVEHER